MENFSVCEFTNIHTNYATQPIVHGITPNTNGAKYMLILKHHFYHPDKVGVVRLSRQMVNALVEGE